MQLNTQPDYMELEIHLSLCSMMENVGCVQGKSIITKKLHRMVSIKFASAQYHTMHQVSIIYLRHYTNYVLFATFKSNDKYIAQARHYSNQQPTFRKPFYCFKVLLCLVLLQVTKCLVPVQTFSVRPKTYLHIVPVTNILCQTKG